MSNVQKDPYIKVKSPTNKDSSDKLNSDGIDELLYTVDEKTGKRTYIESKPAKEIIEMYGLVSINGILYDKDGRIDVDDFKRQLTIVLDKGGLTDLIRKVDSLYNLIVRFANITEPIIPSENEIPVKNGTIYIKQSKVNGEIKHYIEFSPEKKFALYRLPVNYDPKSEIPSRLYEWLNTMFTKDDILGFQCLNGYMLVAKTTGQMAFFIVGEGGEGKSRWGHSILKPIFGDAMVSINLKTFEGQKSEESTAMLENKLVAYQDDVPNSALSETETFKQLISCDTPMVGKRLYKDRFEFTPFARVCGTGNFSVSSLHDLSDGFFRRLYIIRVKPKEPNRIDDGEYDRPILENTSGVLNWMLEGLLYILDRGCNFKLVMSERSKAETLQAKDAATGIVSFIEDCIEFGEEYSISSESLKTLYKDYCIKHGFPKRDREYICNYFKGHPYQEGIELRFGRGFIPGNRDMRGFKGMRSKHRAITIGGGKNE